MVNIEPKTVVNIGLAFPAIFIFMDLDWSMWVPIAAGLAGLYYFNGNFVNKNELRKKEPTQLGPQEPFMNNEPMWEYGPDNIPVKKTYPPNQNDLFSHQPRGRLRK